MSLSIGIDVGVNTGFAISKDKKLIAVTSYSILDAMDACLDLQDQSPTLYIEDPKKGAWIAKTTKKQIGRLQGAGSVKRDFQIWVDFAKKHGFKVVLPSHRNTAKLNAEKFHKLTGWVGQTNQHGRDAAYLVWGR